MPDGRKETATTFSGHKGRWIQMVRQDDAFACDSDCPHASHGERLTAMRQEWPWSAGDCLVQGGHVRRPGEPRCVNCGQPRPPRKNAN